MLRILGLLHGTSNSDYAIKATESLFTQTRLFLGGPASPGCPSPITSGSPSSTSGGRIYSPPEEFLELCWACRPLVLYRECRFSPFTPCWRRATSMSSAGISTTRRSKTTVMFAPHSGPLPPVLSSPCHRYAACRVAEENCPRIAVHCPPTQASAAG